MRLGVRSTLQGGNDGNYRSGSEEDGRVDSCGELIVFRTVVIG